MKKRMMMVLFSAMLLLSACGSASADSLPANEVSKKSKAVEGISSVEAASEVQAPSPTEMPLPTATPSPKQTPLPTQTPSPTQTPLPTETPAPTAPPAAETATTQPAPAEQSSAQSEAPAAPAAETSGQDGSGSGSNFNTYNNPDQQNTSETYVLNTNTMKIHHPSCRSVKKIAPQNYSTSSLSLEELKAQGYSTCGNCF